MAQLKIFEGRIRELKITCYLIDILKVFIQIAGKNVYTVIVLKYDEFCILSTGVWTRQIRQQNFIEKK